MSKLNIQLSGNGRLLHIESGPEHLWLTRDEGIELLERLPSVLVEMLVSIGDIPPVIHADPEPETYPKGPR